jgi:hypothetical protein
MGYRSNNFEEALKNFSKAIEIFPQSMNQNFSKPFMGEKIFLVLLPHKLCTFQC